MPYAATVYKVMIASPNDVEQEREIIREVVAEWNAVHSEERGIVLLPIGWESHSHPEMGERAQAIINRQVVDGCDLLIGVFWSRVGTRTGTAVSGSVEEIERHLAAGKPAMLYFSSAAIPQSADLKQFEAMKKFKKECYGRGLVGDFGSLAEFAPKLLRDLSQKVIQAGWGGSHERLVSEPEPPDPISQLTEQSRAVLLAAAEQDDGTVMTLMTTSGYDVQVGRRSLYEGYEGRKMAAWKAAIEQLLELDLLSGRGYKGEVYEVTAKGWAAADQLRAAQPF